MKVKISIITPLLLLVIGILGAQVPRTVSTLAMGGNTENHIWVSVGQLFAQQTTQNGYEVAAGVSQAQVVDSTYSEEGCENEDYEGHGFHLYAPLAVGIHTADKYEVAGHRLYYDLRKHLALNVNPIYDITSYITYHGELPDGIHEGLNELELKSVKGCDSLVHLYVDLCPFIVRDVDDNPYNTVVISNYCWTQSNLRPVHYWDGSDISKALIYNSMFHPDETANLNTYGRLYTWFSAVHVEEGSQEAPATDDDGFVQGLCPTGWHIPNLLEANTLRQYPAFALRSTDFWVDGSMNTNSTGFSALPAGLFNAIDNRFEEMTTSTNFWAADFRNSGQTIFANSIQLNYYCDENLTPHSPAANAYSVRCVKNHLSIDG